MKYFYCYIIYNRLKGSFFIVTANHHLCAYQILHQAGFVKYPHPVAYNTWIVLDTAIFKNICNVDFDMTFPVKH